jgi:hypothetical protein
MAWGRLVFDPGGTEEQYRAVVDEIGAAHTDAPGRTFLAAGATDGGWLMATVWESQEDFQRWAAEHVGPGPRASWIARLALAAGGHGLHALPRPHPIAACTLGGAATARTWSASGARVYSARLPDPIPAVFGFHEVFHALVIAAGLIFYVAIARVIVAG